MPPRNNYSGADMLRMQRDAEERVREMRTRARTVAQVGDFPNPQQRYWSTEPGRSRQLPSQPLRPPAQQQRQQEPPPQMEEPPTPAPAPAPSPDAEPRQSRHTQQAPFRGQADDSARPTPTPKPSGGASTILGDIMGALSLEEDTLLIAGLILILINQKSDATLLLALAYLLI